MSVPLPPVDELVPACASSAAVTVPSSVGPLPRGTTALDTSGSPPRPRVAWNSLAVKLPLLAAACLLAAIAGFGALLAWEQASQAEAAVEGGARTQARDLARVVAVHLVVTDYIAVENAITSVTPIAGLSELLVADLHGRVMSEAEVDASGLLVPRFRTRRIAPPASASLEQVTREDALIVWVPIALKEPVGWLRMVFSRAAINAERHEIYGQTAGFGVLAALAGMIGMFAFIRPRIAALREVTRFAEDLKAGTGEQVAVSSSSTEIEALARALNTASCRLEADARTLRDSEAQLRSVVENMPVLLNAFDSQLNFVAWNRECERVSGYTAQEILGNPKAVELLYPDPKYRQYLFDEWRRRGNRFYHWELELTARDGSKRIVAWSNISDEFRIPGWPYWSVGIDLTERAKDERLKDDFISTVNHELRTPLTAIQGALALMRSGAAGQMPPAMRSMVDIAERNSERLLRLIGNILDVQRLEAGHLHLHRVSLDLSQLAAESVKINSLLAKSRGTRLRLTDAALQARVVGDYAKLEQVLTNLISNAIKYSPPGTDVDVSVLRQNGRLRVCVADEGAGIPAGFRDRLFLRFSRADEVLTGKESGSGLGLYISKRIIDEHGGTIGFEPRPQGGAIFYFELAEQLVAATGAQGP